MESKQELFVLPVVKHPKLWDLFCIIITIASFGILFDWAFDKYGNRLMYLTREYILDYIDRNGLPQYEERLSAYSHYNYLLNDGYRLICMGGIDGYVSLFKDDDCILSSWAKKGTQGYKNKLKIEQLVHDANRR